MKKAETRLKKKLIKNGRRREQTEIRETKIRVRAVKERK